MVNELEFLEGIIKSRIESSKELEVYSNIPAYVEILEEIEEIKASRMDIIAKLDLVKKIGIINWHNIGECGRKENIWIMKCKKKPKR